MKNYHPTFVHKRTVMVPGTVHIPSVAEIVLDNLANGIVFVDDFKKGSGGFVKSILP